MDQHYFSSRYTHDDGRPRVCRAICEYLQTYITPADTVLELGLGHGDCINQLRAAKKHELIVRFVK